MSLFLLSTSGPIVAAVLAREGAVHQWRELLGPTDSNKAVLLAPHSIRAKFGTDGSRNAAHGSDSVLSAAREIRFFFPDGMLPTVCNSTNTVKHVDFLSPILFSRKDFIFFNFVSKNDFLLDSDM